ncbi:MAG: ABC transporter permease [Chloroflexota bacterium]|nr:ABC transporter permease [Chloroflexota bacterium]
MTSYVLRRLAQAIPVLLLSSLGVFLLLHLVPGDPAIILAGPDATPEVIDAVRADMGLNQPLPVQYAVWLGHAIHGDLGRSFTSKQPVTDLIAQRLPATAELALAGILLALLVSVPSGILAALHQRRLVDWLISSLSAFAIAIPNFWFGILAILLFALVLGWLPPGGYADVIRDPGAGLKFLALPAVTLALNQAAVTSRFVKASMLDVLYEDYVRTARAKGLRERVLIRRHALRNALVPLATVLGVEFGRLLGGAVIVESVFAWPGMGRLIVQAIANRDYTVVQGALLLLVCTFILVNLLTDVAYGVLDPRIRFASRPGQ